MEISAFKWLRKSLQQAEDRCINHLNELSFQPKPTWEGIDQGFRLVNEFREIQEDALEALARHPSAFPNPAMFTLLKQSAFIYSQSLIVLDDLCRKYRSRP